MYGFAINFRAFGLLIMLAAASSAEAGEGLVEITSGIESSSWDGTQPTAEIRLRLSETVLGWGVTFELTQPYGLSDHAPSFLLTARRNFGDWQGSLGFGDIYFGGHHHLLPFAPRRAIRLSAKTTDGRFGASVFVARTGFGPPGEDEVAGSGLFYGVEVSTDISPVKLSFAAISGRGQLVPGDPESRSDGLSLSASWRSTDGTHRMSGSVAASRTDFEGASFAGQARGVHALSPQFTVDWAWERVDPGFASFGNPGASTDFIRGEVGLAFSKDDLSAGLRARLLTTNILQSPEVPGFRFSTISAFVSRDLDDDRYLAFNATASRTRLVFSENPDDFAGSDSDKVTFELSVGGSQQVLSWEVAAGVTRSRYLGLEGGDERSTFLRLDLSAVRGQTSLYLGNAVETRASSWSGRSALATLNASVEHLSRTGWTFGMDISLGVYFPDDNMTGLMALTATRNLTDRLQVELRADHEFGYENESRIGLYLTATNPFQF